MNHDHKMHLFSIDLSLSPEILADIPSNDLPQLIADSEQNAKLPEKRYFTSEQTEMYKNYTAHHNDILLFTWACERSLVLVKHFAEKFGLTSNNVTKSGALSAAARSGKLDVVKYLLENFNVGRYTHALEMMVVHGHLEMLQYALEKLTFDINTLMSRAIQNGHLDIVKYLFEKYGFQNASALNEACKYGHLDILKYIISALNLTIDELRAKNKLVFRYACQYGHLNIVEFLVEKCAITVEDITQNTQCSEKHCCISGPIFNIPCMMNHLHIVRYFNERFCVGPEVIRKTLVGVAQMGYLDIMKYFVESGNVSIACIRSEKILLHVAEMKHYKLLDYLLNKFNISLLDIDENDSGIRRPSLLQR
jgi:Ankyrin repeats (3 copies)